MGYWSKPIDVDKTIRELYRAQSARKKFRLVQQLLEAGSPRATDVLVHVILDSKEYELRLFVARALGKLVEPKNLRQVIDKLGVVPGPLKEEVVKAFSYYQRFNGVRALVDCLDCRERHVSGEAHNGLLRLKETDTARLQRELTLMALGDDDERMRQLAVKALHALAFPRGTEVLTFIAENDESPQIRSIALRGIPGFGNRQTLETLLYFVKANPEKNVAPLSLALARLCLRFQREQDLLSLLSRLNIKDVARGALEELTYSDKISDIQQKLLLILRNHPEIRASELSDQIAELLFTRKKAEQDLGRAGL